MLQGGVRSILGTVAHIGHTIRKGPILKAKRQFGKQNS